MSMISFEIDHRHAAMAFADIASALLAATNGRSAIQIAQMENGRFVAYVKAEPARFVDINLLIYQHSVDHTVYADNGTDEDVEIDFPKERVKSILAFAEDFLQTNLQTKIVAPLYPPVKKALADYTIAELDKMLKSK